MSNPTLPGVLPSQWIRQAIVDGIITAATPVQAGQVQPNSLDLRVGDHGFRIQCSFLPGFEGVDAKLDRFAWYKLDVRDSGTLLERNQVYLFPLQERLALTAGLSGKANAKSTTGRLDVFTRVITEHGVAFDEVPEGYRGRLFLEVVPRSFAIVVRPGDSMAQIRFQTGDAVLGDVELRELLDAEPIIVEHDGSHLSAGEMRVSQGVFLTVQLSGATDGLLGYRARKNRPPVDLRKLGGHSRADFWEEMKWRADDPVILEPDEFYIFASRERVRLPSGYCAEMVPFDAGSGEVRTHYAGFFDSGFGYAPNQPAEESASAVVLEVRNRDVPFLLDDGAPIFRLLVMRNTEKPDLLYGSQLRSNYQGQRLRLAKQFD